MTILRPVPLPALLIPGKLHLSSMPGNYKPFDLYLDEIRDAKIDHILCLVSDEEIAEHSPDYLAAIRSGEIPAKLWRHAIPDHGVPENHAKLDKTIDQMQKLLLAGESIVIHCAAGVGRTGMVAIKLLIRLGFSPHVASHTIEHNRGQEHN